jgi:hypothetical protein
MKKFRDTLDTLDKLSQVKVEQKKKTLKESPGDTYYVTKMKEKFSKMEKDATVKEDFNSSESKELDTTEKSSEDTVKKDLMNALETLLDWMEQHHPEAHKNCNKAKEALTNAKKSCELEKTEGKEEKPNFSSFRKF